MLLKTTQKPISTHYTNFLKHYHKNIISSNLSILLLGKKLARKPKFQKNNRSVEFKQSGWKLSENYKRISFTSCNIGSLKLKGTRNLQDFSEHKILRVRILKRADGYYIQFCIDFTRKINHIPTGKAIGIDVGLKHFLTDSDSNVVKNPRFLH